MPSATLEQLSKALLDVANIKIPVRLLTYWLAEWGYNVKASGGRQKTGMYSVDMLPLTRERKVKMVGLWIDRNKARQSSDTHHTTTPKHRQ